jgi:RHS repeat-associated protein
MGALLSGTVPPLAESNSALINSNLGASGSNFSSFISSNNTIGTCTTPKAFLNIIFFDQQFNFIPGDPSAPGVGTNVIQVSTANAQDLNLPLQQKAPKNGWVYIYLSNESNEDVYFDNFSVSQVHSPISEETHYYAFGEKIAGISNLAFNKVPSKYHYQGDYSEEEQNTLWNEFELRMYDPQIGRWTGADPYDQFPSPYVGMGDDPVNNVDPSGGDLADVIGLAGGGAIGAAIGFFVAKDQKGSTIWEDIGAGIIGGFVGSGLGYATAETLYPTVGSEASWLNSLAAYYTGLFGGNRELPINITGQLCTNCAAYAPDMWSWLPSLSLPNVSMPNLFGWVDDVQNIWTTIDIQTVVSVGWANRDPGDKVMTRTFLNVSGTEGSDFEFGDVHDETTIDVPYDPNNTRTKTEIESPGDLGNWDQVRHYNWVQNGSRYTVTVDQHSSSGRGFTYDKHENIVTLNKAIGAKESKVKVITQKRMARPIRRLRIFGIKLPFTHKK